MSAALAFAGAGYVPLDDRNIAPVESFAFSLTPKYKAYLHKRESQRAERQERETIAPPVCAQIDLWPRRAPAPAHTVFAPERPSGGVLRVPRAVLYAGPIAIVNGCATLTLLEHDPAPEPSEHPPWGARLVAVADNFRRVSAGTPPKTITAQPRGSRGAPKWTRSATALERWFEGRTSWRENILARLHEREALHRVRGAWAGWLAFELRKAPRYRKKRPPKPDPAPPTFTPAELAAASAAIDERCAGPLRECAWHELRFPPKRCKPVTSLKMKVTRAIERARRSLREDACRWSRRSRSIFYGFALIKE